MLNGLRESTDWSHDHRSAGGERQRGDTRHCRTPIRGDHEVVLGEDGTDLLIRHITDPQLDHVGEHPRRKILTHRRRILPEVTGDREAEINAAAPQFRNRIDRQIGSLVGPNEAEEEQTQRRTLRHRLGAERQVRRMGRHRNAFESGARTHDGGSRLGVDDRSPTAMHHHPQQ